MGIIIGLLIRPALSNPKKIASNSEKRSAARARWRARRRRQARSGADDVPMQEMRGAQEGARMPRGKEPGHVYRCAPSAGAL